MSELESLFSATAPNSGAPGGKTNRRGSGLKSDKVHLVSAAILCFSISRNLEKYVFFKISASPADRASKGLQL